LRYEQVGIENGWIYQEWIKEEVLKGTDQVKYHECETAYAFLAVLAAAALAFLAVRFGQGQ
jgi:hypothetical protein